MDKQINDLINNETREKDIENSSDNLFDKLNIDENTCRRIPNTISEEANDLKSAERDMLLSSIATSFPKEQSLNEKLKLKFSITLLVLLSILVGSIVIIVILMGVGLLKYDQWTIRLFITGVFVEIVGIVQIIVTSLFPKEDRKIYFDFLDRYTHHDNKKE